MRILSLLVVFTCFQALAQNDSTTLSLLFMGDIMGHDTQINSAKQNDGSYDYTEVFKYLKDEISSVDLAIANLEVTLAGPPFKGYPQFSSPDALAVAAKDAGIDIFGTANNHSVDRGKSGIIRTIDVLDSLNIPHTGTYKSAQHREENNPMIYETHGFTLAILNYTYGTNGIPVPEPTKVNLINIESIKNDVSIAKSLNVDKIILFIHWGTEYQHQPNDKQVKLADQCIEAGVDIIIGSHPHVIQKSEWNIDSTDQSEQFITYSLGNFISNQRKQYTDGGQMVKIVLRKDANETKIIEAGHLLTWVYTPVINGKKHFHILPCAKYEVTPDFFITPEHYDKMKLFISDSRNLLNTNNNNVREYFFYNNQWDF